MLFKKLYLSTLLLILFVIPLSANARVVYVENYGDGTASLANAQSAYNAASNNDTIVFPACADGDCVWTSYLSIEKPVTIMGAADHGTKLTASGTLADGDMDVFRVYGHDHTISKNDVSNFSGGIREHLDFVQTFATIGDPNRDSYNILIDSNFVHNLAGQIGDIQCILSPNIHDWTFRNNVFANITGTFAVGIPRVSFYNNTFYKVSIAHPFSFRIIAGTHNGIEGVVKNNLFVNCANGRTDAGWYGKQADTIVDYNYVACGENFVPPGAEYFNEIHCIKGGNPKFLDMSNNDFRLEYDSPAKDSGTTLTSFSVDKDGITRPQGSAWDIGAYEYRGNISIMGVYSPKGMSGYYNANGMVGIAPN